MLTALRRVRRTSVVVATSVAALTASTLAYADGVDVSHWQGSISWSTVKAGGVQFAFMKATESTTYTDTRLAANWAGAKSAGLYRGAYHFARPSTGSAAAQARYFVSKVGSFTEPGVLPPVLDLEASGGLSPSALRSWTQTWLDTVEQLTGRVPVIYVSPSFWEYYLANSTAFTRYPLWIAHYGVSSPRVPGGWSRWTFWQRTSTGSVAGIAGNVDVNRFSGTTAELASLAGTTGGGTGPVVPGPTVPTVGATALTLAPSAASAPAGGAVTFAGALTRTDGGAPVTGAPVVLSARTTGTTAWTTVATGATDATGRYALRAVVSRSTYYRTSFAGGATAAPSASPETQVLLTPPASLRLDLHAERTDRVAKATPVMIYGHALTAAGPVTTGYVRFYKRPATGGPWTYVRSGRRVAPTGWYSTRVYPSRDMVFKAVSVGTPTLQAATSGTVTIRVR
jgi:GH25 family lysozyme M1 (1,4-beta-N-acetylmuramidase)